jgi:hypothetical protein
MNVIKPTVVVQRKNVHVHAPRAIRTAYKRVPDVIVAVPQRVQPKPVAVAASQAVVYGRPVIKPRLNPAKLTKIVKPPRVEYLVSDPSPESYALLKELRGCGAGKALLIIGNGPSINEVDLPAVAHLQNVDVMTINHPDQRIWPTKYWLFCDHTQLNRHLATWEAFNGWIITSSNIKKRKSNSIQIKNLQGNDFSLNLMEGMHIGRSSVYAAMQVAHFLAYDEVYIFGCDMAKVGDQLHFYGVNLDAPPDVRANRFAAEAEFYAAAGEKLDERIRKKYYFCSEYNLWPFTERYNKLDHKKAIEIIAAKYGERNG